MPVFKFHLKDAEGSGESRHISVAAADEDEALETIERQEAKKVGFVLDPSEAADFDRQLKAGQLSGRNKARLFAHMQQAPYKIVKGA